jgi:hypothetical protein
MNVTLSHTDFTPEEVQQISVVLIVSSVLSIVGVFSVIVVFLLWKPARSFTSPLIVCLSISDFFGALAVLAGV